MVMRVKYKTKPGDQFAIRKEVYRLMQEAFRQAGIEFAHRNVTVYMPPETGGETSAPASEDPQSDGGANREIQRQAAAAAALATIQAEEEANAKKKSEK